MSILGKTHFEIDNLYNRNTDLPTVSTDLPAWRTDSIERSRFMDSSFERWLYRFYPGKFSFNTKIFIISYPEFSGF